MAPMAKIVEAYKKHIWSILLFSMVSNLLLLILPIYSLQLFDRVISSRSVETLVMLSIVVAVSFVAFGILYLARALVIAETNSWIDRHVVPELLVKSITQSCGIERVAIGNHLRQLNNIKNFIAGHAINFFFDVPWSLVFLAVVFIIHPYQGIVCLVGIIVIFLMAVIYEGVTAKSIDESEEKFNENIKIADEASRNAEAVVSLGMVGRTVKNWKNQYEKYLTFHHDVNLKSNSILSLLKTIRYLLQILVMALGVYLVLKNQMTMGGVIACSTLISRALSPFENCTASWKSFVEARKSFFKLKEVFPGNDNDDVLIDLPVPTGALTVENVSYVPSKNHEPVVKEVSFRLEPGESMGIIGRNAAGKSTLLKMLVGVLVPTSGEVRLDGASMHYALQHDFGKHLGYLPQHPQLFDKTVIENIARLQREEINSNEVIRVTTMLGIHDMILRMPKGYETKLGPDACFVSAGQRQAIALARAFYGDPRYIVLDEPNTNLDHDCELGLVKALKATREKGVTLIIVTHTQWLLKEMHKAMVIDNGELKLFGDVNQVIERITKRA
jgi:ATP-binding cassette subfamily B protein